MRWKTTPLLLEGPPIVFCNVMRVLFVSSGNAQQISPFVFEQGLSLKKAGICVNHFLVHGKGLLGYLRNLPKLRERLNGTNYDLVHAHFGLSGMLCGMQRICPVIVTYQGCDINRIDLRILSNIATKCARHNIFVSEDLANKAKTTKKQSVIPYGIDVEKSFRPLNKRECRKTLNFNQKERIGLFSSSFGRIEKNYELAKKAMFLVGDVRLIELSLTYSRDQVVALLNACDFLLLTSIREGSPQVIKEAMACNCPIVSTEVGDVKEVIGDTEGCYIASYQPKDVAQKIGMALGFGRKTNGRERILSLQLDLDSIADRIIKVYERTIRKREWDL